MSTDREDEGDDTTLRFMLGDMVFMESILDMGSAASRHVFLLIRRPP
jgi:hypothetical protein